MAPPDDVTALLADWSRGDRSALERLLPLVYAELRRIAARGLAYIPFLPSLDFWLFDFATGRSRQLTRLSHQGRLSTFDITPDGKAIVFDRSRENSDIVLIDLPK